MATWRDRYCNTKKGICDFSENYDFFFKWLANKLASCFIVRGGPDTVNKQYMKLHLMLDGYIAFTKINGELYAVSGAPGGEPDEYYLPTIFTLANPILGSKTLNIRDFRERKQDAVLVTNTAIDRYNAGLWSCGMFDLVHQTATLLADNIVSIQCCQINSRVQAILTAESDTQALAAETALKQLYAGAPFTVVRSDIIEKIGITPIANASTSQTISELLELHNYIIANFFKSIGVTANAISKKERLITDEIDAQQSSVALSLTEILESWLRGFDEVNNFFGTDFEIELNPVIVKPFLAAADIEPEPEIIETNPALIDMQEQPAQPQEPEPDTAQPQEPETAEPPSAEEPAESLEEAAEAVEAVAEFLTGEESEGGAEDNADPTAANDADSGVEEEEPSDNSI